jgi:hypothetical protein
VSPAGSLGIGQSATRHEAARARHINEMNISQLGDCCFEMLSACIKSSTSFYFTASFSSSHQLFSL